MGRVVVSEFATLDGVFDDPGGSEGTAYGGWQIPLMGEDESAYKFEELKNADALLLGRVTYEGFAKAWPTMEGSGEFGELMNSLPKHVATLSLSEFGWNNTSALEADIMRGVQRLKEQYQRDIVVMGSGQLVKTLLENGQVDELRLMTYPIMLGEGRRLLDGMSRKKLQFVGLQQFKNGTVLLTYSQTQPEV